METNSLGEIFFYGILFQTYLTLARKAIFPTENKKQIGLALWLKSLWFCCSYCKVHESNSDRTRKASRLSVTRRHHFVWAILFSFALENLFNKSLLVLAVMLACCCIIWTEWILLSPLSHMKIYSSVVTVTTLFPSRASYTKTRQAIPLAREASSSAKVFEQEWVGDCIAPSLMVLGELLWCLLVWQQGKPSCCCSSCWNTLCSLKPRDMWHLHVVEILLGEYFVNDSKCISAGCLPLSIWDF